jgi:hypothetical protein
MRLEFWASEEKFNNEDFFLIAIREQLHKISLEMQDFITSSSCPNNDFLFLSSPAPQLTPFLKPFQHHHIIPLLLEQIVFPKQDHHLSLILLVLSNLMYKALTISEVKHSLLQTLYVSHNVPSALQASSR